MQWFECSNVTAIAKHNDGVVMLLLRMFSCAPKTSYCGANSNPPREAKFRPQYEVFLCTRFYVRYTNLCFVCAQNLCRLCKRFYIIKLCRQRGSLSFHRVLAAEKEKLDRWMGLLPHQKAHAGQTHRGWPARMKTLPGIRTFN